jgi:glycosyltransferase involved in cell wall biosynthesis
VPVDELLAWTADADVGVSLLQDTCENHRLALPNKVFEYVAAGVPVVVSDLPELRRLVTDHDLGWTVDGADSQALAAALQAPATARLARRVARFPSPLRWTAERGRLTEVYRRLGGRREHAPGKPGHA